MPRRSKGLTALEVARALPGPPGRNGHATPKRLSDGGGLYLLVRVAEAKYWVFRYTYHGRERTIGLGPAVGRAAVTLTDARQKARRLLDQVRDGKDPRVERDTARQAKQAVAGKTFLEVAELYLAEKSDHAIRNDGDRKSRRSILRRFVYERIGDMPLSAIDTPLVLEVLKPVWGMPVVARRLRGLIDRIFGYGRIHGWCAGDNPARWRGHLEHVLPAPTKVRPVEHHAALPWKDVPAFMANLRRRNDIPARCLEFMILTASRKSEARGALWQEIDLGSAIWTVPARRANETGMKSGREHRVPLSRRALEILEEMASFRSDEAIFPGSVKRQSGLISHKMLYDHIRACVQPSAAVPVPHGFRSSFRDWVAEATNYQRELAEAALDHELGNKTETAYQRGDLFDKRRAVMDDWAAFCGSAPTDTPAFTLAPYFLAPDALVGAGGAPQLAAR